MEQLSSTFMHEPPFTICDYCNRKITDVNDLAIFKTSKYELNYHIECSKDLIENYPN